MVSTLALTLLVRIPQCVAFTNVRSTKIKIIPDSGEDAKTAFIE